MGDPLGLIQLQCEAWVRIENGIFQNARGCTVETGGGGDWQITLSNPISDADLMIFPIGQAAASVNVSYNSAGSTAILKEVILFNAGGAPDPNAGAYLVICRVFP